MAVNKSVKKCILAFALALFVAPLCAQNKLILNDSASLLSAEQQELLKKDMEPILQYGSVAFISNSELNPHSESAADFSADLYSQYFGTSSGTLFLIDMYSRRIQIYSDGEIYKVITSTRANIITDNIYQFATDGKYYECAKNAFEQINTYLEGGFVFAPMRYATNFLMAMVLSLLILFIYVYKKRAPTVKEGSLVEGMKKKAEIEREDITLENRFSTQHIDVENLEMYLEEKVLHSSSSSGGGGHGGGGGHSGGGGGHGF